VTAGLDGGASLMALGIGLDPGDLEREFPRARVTRFDAHIDVTVRMRFRYALVTHGVSGVADPVRLLNTVRNALEPGGECLLLEYCHRDARADEALSLARLSTLAAALAPLVEPPHEDLHRVRGESTMSFEGRAAKVARTAGFVRADIRAIEAPFLLFNLQR
jgi:hypothetical protein